MCPGKVVGIIDPLVASLHIKVRGQLLSATTEMLGFLLVLK